MALITEYQGSKKKKRMRRGSRLLANDHVQILVMPIYKLLNCNSQNFQGGMPSASLLVSAMRVRDPMLAPVILWARGL